MKKFLEDFKAFALKGNVIDMAVGVIIGAAFKTIVDSLVSDIFTPLLNLLGAKDIDGKVSGGTFFIGSAEVKYGNFLAAIINFVIMAFVIFLFVRLINKMMSLGKHEKPAEKTTQTCPFCKSEIHKDATRCPNCTSELKAAG